MPRPLQNSLSQVPALVDLWNSGTPSPFRMDGRLMREHLEYPGALVVVEGEPWRGALWARQGSLGATLDALVVSPDARRQGIGRALLTAFRETLEPNASWRFGGGNHHFVPGLPDCLSEAHGFFSALGMVPDWHAHDLLWQAQVGEEHWDEQTYRLLDATRIGELRELLRHFGKRWQEDTADRCQSLREGSSEEIMGAFHQGALVGFCHIWSPRSRRLGPSTFWLDRGDNAWGGVGPLGVHPELRGLGLGAGVVESSMAYLRRQGALRIGVDWTGLPAFYERCAFRPWLTYRGYHPE